MLNFIAIDFETARYSRESAISVGLAKYRNGQLVDAYASLIRPPVLYIRPDFTDIHGLTVDDVRDASLFPEVWQSGIAPFIEGLPLAAHNASFDMSVLRAALQWYGLPVPALPHFCSLALSRRAWPGLQSHALTSLAGHFGIVYQAHDALDDAKTCAGIVHLAAEALGIDSVDGLVELSACLD